MAKKGVYEQLKKHYRKLVEDLESELERKGYKLSSVLSYKRKASKFLFFCQKKRIPLNLKAMRNALGDYRQKASSDDVTRAKYFLRFLEGKLKEASSKKGAEGQAEEVKAKEATDKLLSQAVNACEVFLAKLTDSLEKNNKFYLDCFIGKPVEIVGVDGKRMQGELKKFDKEFFYLLVRKETFNRSKFPRRPEAYLPKRAESEKCYVRAVSKHYVCSISVLADLVSLGENNEKDLV